MPNILKNIVNKATGLFGGNGESDQPEIKTPENRDIPDTPKEESPFERILGRPSISDMVPERKDTKEFELASPISKIQKAPSLKDRLDFSQKKTPDTKTRLGRPDDIFQAGKQELGSLVLNSSPWKGLSKKRDTNPRELNHSKTPHLPSSQLTQERRRLFDNELSEDVEKAYNSGIDKIDRSPSNALMGQYLSSRLKGIDKKESAKEGVTTSALFNIYGLGKLETTPDEIKSSLKEEAAQMINVDKEADQQDVISRYEELMEAADNDTRRTQIETAKDILTEEAFKPGSKEIEELRTFWQQRNNPKVGRDVEDIVSDSPGGIEDQDLRGEAASQETLRKVRSMFLDGSSFEEIEEETGVGESQVRGIYRHLGNSGRMPAEEIEQVEGADTWRSVKTGIHGYNSNFWQFNFTLNRVLMEQIKPDSFLIADWFLPETRKNLWNNFLKKKASNAETAIKTLQKEHQRVAVPLMDDEPGISNWNEFVYQATNGGMSLLTAIGIGAITKNKYIAAAFLSGMESAGAYNEARDAGKTADEALGIAATSGTGTFLLEKVGLDFITSSAGGPMVSILIGTAGETGQEVLQTWWQNLVKKYTYDEAQEITEGTMDTILATLPSSLLGSAGSEGAQAFARNQVIGDIQRQGNLSKQEATEIYENLRNNIEDIRKNIGETIRKRGYNDLSKMEQRIQEQIDVPGEDLLSAPQGFEYVNDIEQLADQAKRSESLEAFQEQLDQDQQNLITDKENETIENFYEKSTAREQTVTDEDPTRMMEEPGEGIEVGDNNIKIEGTDRLKTDVEDDIYNFAEKRFSDDLDLEEDVSIEGVDLGGSRIDGDPGPLSDLDARIYYRGDISEDQMWDYFRDIDWETGESITGEGEYPGVETTEGWATLDAEFVNLDQADESVLQEFREKVEGTTEEGPLSDIKPHPEMSEGLANSPLKVKFQEEGTLYFPNEQIESPADLAFVFNHLQHNAQENLYVVALQNNTPIGVELVSMGSMDAAIADPRDVLPMLIDKDADSFWVVHNHPSGNVEPSQADMQTLTDFDRVAGDLGINTEGLVIINTSHFGFVDREGRTDTIPYAEYTEGTVEVPKYSKYIEWHGDPNSRPRINNSQDIAKTMQGIAHNFNENVLVTFTDTNNGILFSEVMAPQEITLENLGKLGTVGRATYVSIGTNSQNAGVIRQQVLDNNLKTKLRNDFEIKLLDAVTVKDNGEWTSIYGDQGTVKDWKMKAMADGQITLNPDDTVPGLDYLDAKGVEEVVNDYVTNWIVDTDVQDSDFRIKDMAVTGSRAMNRHRPDSDLDIILEYEGTMREDDIYNALNGEDRLTIDGIDVDINPIKPSKSGTIQDFVNRSKEYWAEREVREPGTEEQPFVRKRETTLLKERVKNYARGVREGRIDIRREAEQVVKEFQQMLKDAGVQAKDRAKFISMMRNIATAPDPTVAFENNFDDIQDRINRYIESQAKRDLRKNIKRELKYTKPVKEGDRRVGKYNYEGNKFFKRLREYNNLTQDQALDKLEILEKDLSDDRSQSIIPESQKIEMRFLQMKGNGMYSSVELFDQVLNDIRRMKEAGRRAKDLNDYEDLIEQKQARDDLVEALEEARERRDLSDKGFIRSTLQKAVDISLMQPYEKYIANTNSLFNALFGQDFANKYDPLLAAMDKETALYHKNKEMNEGIADILEIDRKDVPATILDLQQQTYEMTNKDGRTMEFTKLELMDIYNSIKNKTIRERYLNEFGANEVYPAVESLTPKEIQVADFMQDFIQDYTEVFNKLNIERTGRDMGRVENYWPATTEHEQDVLDDIRQQGETPSAARHRSTSRLLVPRPTNAYLKAKKHINQGEHVRHISRKYEELKRMFNDRNIRLAMEEIYGEYMYDLVDDHIERLSLNHNTKQLNAVEKIFDKALNNWTVAKIAMPNISSPLRQLGSVTNFAVEMPSGEWVKGFKEGVASPKETFDFMWENNPFLEARFNKGYSRALNEALEGVNKLKLHKQNYIQLLTTLLRAGDVGAIIYGGYPYFMHEYNKALDQGMTEEEALNTASRKLKKLTGETQQENVEPALSIPQSSTNTAVKAFFRFKNTSNQYLRKIYDDIIRHQRGEITTKKLSKTIVNYLIIQSIMYIALGYAAKALLYEAGTQFGLRERPEDEGEDEVALDIMEQIVTQPFQAIPILAGITSSAYGKMTGQQQYKVIQTPVIDDINTAFQIATKEDMTWGDYIDVLSTPVEILSPTPAKTLKRYYEYILGADEDQGASQDMGGDYNFEFDFEQEEQDYNFEF